MLLSVSIMKMADIPDRIARAVNMTIGVGKAISATKGASITKPRLAKFDMPMEVTTKRVGNILGCTIQIDTKVPTTPILASPTRMGKVHPGLAGMIRRMPRPAKLYSA